MRRVLKWPVPIDDQWHEIGDGPVALVERFQDTGTGFDLVPTAGVWTVEDDVEIGFNDEMAKSLGLPGNVRVARVYGTGHELPPSVLADHLGSYVAGAGVWHIFGMRIHRDEVAGDG